MYERKQTYDMKEVFDFLKENQGSPKRKNDRCNFNGEMIKTYSLRYLTFQQSGTICTKCGLKGEYFAMERDQGTTYHFNLYGHDNTNKEVMLCKQLVGKEDSGKKIYTTMCYNCICTKSKDL